MFFGAIKADSKLFSQVVTHIAGRSMHGVTTLENWQLPPKLNIPLPYDPEIPVLAIFPRGMKIHVSKKPYT